MLTGITYNCNLDSLADADQTEFVEAFENEVRVKPKYRELTVAVKFQSGTTSYLEFASDDWEADISHEEELRAEFDRFAEKAFKHC